MLKNFIIIAWRNVLRNPLHSIINVVGLSIGISACLVIFLIVNFELSYDKFHLDGDRIYRVYSEFSGDLTGLNRGVPSAVPPTVKSNFTGFESLTGFQTWSAKVFVEDPAKGRKDFDNQRTIIFTGPDYFNVFTSYKWIEGSPAVSLSKPFQVVLAESAARKYFGIQNVREAVGREIHYRDSLIVTVSGIVADIKQNSDLDFTDFISFSTAEKSWLKNSFDPDNWGSTNSNSQFFIKLSPNVSASSWEPQLQKLSDIYVQKNKNSNWKIKFHLQPLNDLHFNSELEIFDHSRAPAHLITLRLLIAVALLLLVIAAINFINLETAQAVRRSKEVGLRKLMGSSRGKLIINFLLQSVIITLFAAVISVPLSQLAIIGFTEFIPIGVQLHFDLFTVEFFFLSVMVVSFLAGFYPAFSLSSVLPVLALKNQVGIRHSRSSVMRKGLIVFQFSFAQVLILSTFVVGSQISFMMNTDLGFTREAVVYFYSPWREAQGKVEVLKNALEELPEIKSLSLSEQPPAEQGYMSSTFTYNNGREELHHNVYRKFGDSAFMTVYDLKLLAGRNLLQSDTIREFIINETYAKLLGFQNSGDALGKSLMFGKQRIPIVGVVKDFHFQSLHNPMKPVVIANQKNNFYCFGIKLANSNSGKNISNALQKMEKAWKTVYPDQKFDYHFLDDTVAKFYEKERRMAKLVNMATGIAILISCLGLFGLASFTTVQRTKEIGIRKVLGATVSSIVSLLSKEFMKPVMVAFLIAAPLSYYFGEQWLVSFAFRTEIGWEMFAVTVIVSVLIALLSVSYQAIKAGMADPVASLRYE